jgi:aryl-alcohol dehydrogenase-like predicted oxidoreductase
MRVSEMALGTWGLSGDGYGPVDAQTAERVVARAIDIGVTLVDTCDAYGAGRMEELLGRTLSEHPDVAIVTKGGTDRTTDPPRKHFDPEYVRQALERSLKRLKREQVDIYLLHNPSVSTLDRDEAVEALHSFQKEGKIRHWGVSAGDANVARAALRRGAQVVELAYNLFHGADLHSIGGDVMVDGAGVLACSTLSYGLFAGTWSSEREFAQGDHRNDRWTRLELARRVEQLHAIQFLVRRDVRTLRGAAVRYVLANHLVSSAVLGPRSVEQLEQLVRETGAGPLYLRDDDLSEIPRALSSIGVEA